MEVLLLAQRALLASIVAELEPEIAALPMPEGVDWTGPAHAIYSFALIKLVEDAQLALAGLRWAIAATDAAIGAEG